MMTLVIGGAASGKSAFAESLCLAGPAPRVYLATMEPAPGEEAVRIGRHRSLRAGKGFLTVERALNVAAAAREVPATSTLLLEDAGNLVANELFSPASAVRGAHSADVARKVSCDIIELARACANMVVVTVDVFEDGETYDEGTAAYRRALACVNAQVAKVSDRVVEVVCGIPVWMKGEASK